MDRNNQLEKLKKEIKSQIVELKKQAKPVDLNGSMGRLSRMDALQMQQMAMEQVKRAEQRLYLIEEAIKRLKEGSYGFCLECEEEIEANRLNARPEVSLCLGCQEFLGKA